jgi:hypothetical protein
MIFCRAERAIWIRAGYGRTLKICGEPSRILYLMDSYTPFMLAELQMEGSPSQVQADTRARMIHH